jgi:cyclophilin family peptidyl-prolyl cis-trans isomerase
MSKRAWEKCDDQPNTTQPATATRESRRRQPRLESLEERQLLAASLATIPNVSVPAYLGYQVALNGSAAGGPETFTASSSNPRIKVSVAQGHFITFHIKHTAAPGVANDVPIDGNVTIQLFGDLTPNTAKLIESFVTEGFYNGKLFHRVANQFPSPTGFIVQGGSASGNGSGSSGLPGTPFPDEFKQQLAFTGTYQVAMANAGPDTNDTQFFFTTATPRFLDFGYTVFGQVVAGQKIVTDMSKVAVGGAGQTTPISPIMITSAKVSTTNANGVIHVDATHANAGQTSVITVTAKQGSTSVKRTFTVNVGANNMVERPFVKPLANMTAGLNQTVFFQIPAASPTPGLQLAYTIAGGVNRLTGSFFPVANASVALDQTTGIVRVVPNAGYSGPIKLLYGVRYAGLPDTPSSYEYHTVTLRVNASVNPVTQAPIAFQMAKNAPTDKTTIVQLVGGNTNPGTAAQFTYTIASQPLHGTITNFNASTGKLSYTPPKGFKGIDVFQYTVTCKIPGKPTLTSLLSYVDLIVS